VLRGCVAIYIQSSPSETRDRQPSLFLYNNIPPRRIVDRIKTTKSAPPNVSSVDLDLEVTGINDASPSPFFITFSRCIPPCFLSYLSSRLSDIGRLPWQSTPGYTRQRICRLLPISISQSSHRSGLLMVSSIVASNFCLNHATSSKPATSQYPIPPRPFSTPICQHQLRPHRRRGLEQLPVE
jgi:hypothetical protein